MACGGFTCSKNSLIVLNVLYIVVAFILIGVASYGRTSNYVTSISLVGGIIACGVFLLFVAALGLYGALKHNQVCLFFYMIILFLLFLVQFGFACACLAVSHDQQKALAERGWRVASNDTRSTAQDKFGCCGFDGHTQLFNVSSPMGHPACNECCSERNGTACCYEGGAQCDKCDPCYDKLQPYINSALKGSGAVGLIFSITEIVGMTVSWRYRKMSDQAHVPLT